MNNPLGHATEEFRAHLGFEYFLIPILALAKVKDAWDNIWQDFVHNFVTVPQSFVVGTRQ